MTNHGDDWGEIERALSWPPRAPASFADRVMARVADARREENATLAVRWSGAPALEWWVRAAADPASVLALSLAALLLWRADVLSSALQAALGGLMSALRVPAPAPLVALGRAASQGETTLALGLALLPAVIWGSWRLCQWLERTSQPTAPAARR